MRDQQKFVFRDGINDRMTAEIVNAKKKSVMVKCFSKETF